MNLFLFIDLHRSCIETYGITYMTEYGTNYDIFRQILSRELIADFSRGERITAVSFFT